MNRLSLMLLGLLLLVSGTPSMADTFGTGAISSRSTSCRSRARRIPTSGIPAGTGFTFSGVNHDYRMGTFEITNDQWNKFTASLGVPVTGNPSTAYDASFYDWGTGTTNVPANMISWYEAAQFVNWLNTSTGHQAAYKFTGTQGTSNYTFATWSTAEAAGGTNLYRHKDAYYFLPTEDEWVKAAYWNGTSLQTYATKAGETLTQGNGTSGTGWNYYTTQLCHHSLRPVERRQRQRGAQRHVRHDGQRLGMDGEPLQRPHLWRRFVAGFAGRGDQPLLGLSGLLVPQRRLRHPDVRARSCRIPRGKCS